MEKISAEEFDQLGLHGRGSSTKFYTAIFGLGVNDALIIKKTEWRPKYPPTKMVISIEKKYGRSYIRGALSDRSGWAVKRVK
jgi:hypothetical protein